MSPNNPKQPDLEAVMAYQHPDLIQRLERSLGLSQQKADDLFQDTKRFLFLCATSPTDLRPPHAIDEGWHHFLMYTEAYTDFCRQYLGRFVHHAPPPLQEISALPDRPATIQSAELVFGPLSENWRAEPTLAGPWGRDDGCSCHIKLAADEEHFTIDVLAFGTEPRSELATA